MKDGAFETLWSMLVWLKKECSFGRQQPSAPITPYQRPRASPAGRDNDEGDDTATAGSHATEVATYPEDSTCKVKALDDSPRHCGFISRSRNRLVRSPPGYRGPHQPQHISLGGIIQFLSISTFNCLLRSLIIIVLLFHIQAKQISNLQF